VKRKKVKRLRHCGVNPPGFDRGQIKFWIYLIPIAALMVWPIIFQVTRAFMAVDELFLFPPRLFPRRPGFQNFNELFSLAGRQAVPITRYLANSLAVAILIVLLSLLISVCAGYVLSKKNFKGKKLLFAINTIALMFTPAAVAIPRYLVIVNLGLLDTFAVHILPMLAMPVGLFLVKQFVDQLPDALIEAAQIDGASDYFIVRKIVVPMISPALATVAILAFQMSWGDIATSTNLITNESLRTFPFYVANIVDPTNPHMVAGFAAAQAGGLLILLPNLILFVLLQSRVMNTMAHSGIK